MNPWLNHVKNIQQKNPQLTFKEVLIKAKTSYKRGGDLLNPSRFKVKKADIVYKLYGEQLDENSDSDDNTISIKQHHRPPNKIIGQASKTPKQEPEELEDEEEIEEPKNGRNLNNSKWIEFQKQYREKHPGANTSEISKAYKKQKK